MRIGEIGRRPVRPRDFWIAVVTVVLLAGGMSVYFLQTGRVPQVPRWYWAATLVLVAGSLVWGVARGGRRALEPWQWVFGPGYVLIAGSHLLPRHAPGGSADLLMNAGSLILGVGVLLQWVEMGSPAARKTRLNPENGTEGDAS